MEILLPIERVHPLEKILGWNDTVIMQKWHNFLFIDENNADWSLKDANETIDLFRWSKEDRIIGVPRL